MNSERKIPPTNALGVVLPILLTGAMACVAIVIGAFWLTSRLDQVAANGTTSLTKLLLEETVEQVTASVEDYAHWDLAYELVQAGKAAEIFEHIGSGAVESDLFDQLFILSSNFELLYEYQSLGGSYDTFEEGADQLGDFLSKLRLLPPQDYGSVSGYADLNGSLVAITAAWIVPDYVEELSEPKTPILIGIVHLDTEWIANLSRHSMQKGHEFVKVQSSIRQSDLAAPLLGPNNTPVGYMSWNKPGLGKKLMVEIWPAILLVCLSILLVCFGTCCFLRQQFTTIQSLKIKANTDPLTGLLNRAGLEQVKQSNTNSPYHRSNNAALIFIDLNGFKKMNDKFGHDAGDIMLEVLSKRLMGAIRKRDFVARVGGDEFVCLVVGNNAERAATTIAKRIRNAVSEPIEGPSFLLTLEASIGVAVSDGKSSWNELMYQADAAMYCAKRKNSLTPVFYGSKGMSPSNVSHGTTGMLNVSRRIPIG